MNRPRALNGSAAQLPRGAGGRRGEERRSDKTPPAVSTWHHGTASEFDEFDLYYAGDNTRHPGADLAIFFSAERPAAMFYRDMSERRIQAIREAEEADGLDAEDMTAIRPRIVEVQIDASACVLNLSTEYEVEIDGKMVSINDDVKILKAAKWAGYDAVLWPHGNANNEGCTLAVLRASVIRVIKNGAAGRRRSSRL